HDARMAKKGITRRGKRHPLATAIKDLGSQALFQILHAATGSRQRQEATFCTFGHALRRRHVHDKLEVGEIEMHARGAISLNTPKTRFTKRELAATKTSGKEIG